MPALTNLFVFLLILGSAILIHELGHFVVAILFGVKIQEFGIGLPPRMLTIGHWRGTEISLNWIPLGGFVRPVGEFDAEESGGLAANPPHARMAVLTAGATCNLLLSFLLLTAAFLSGGPAKGRIRVVNVTEGSPAEEAGLMTGDLILGINGEMAGTATALRSTIQEGAGRLVKLEVSRSESRLVVLLEPRASRPSGRGWAGFATHVDVDRYLIPEAIASAAEQIWTIFHETIQSLASLIDGQQGGFRFIGPVGLKQASDWALEQADQWNAYFPVPYFAALINAGLAFTNLLPLPALDGGRIAFVLLEVITSRRISGRLERHVHAIGAFCLILSMVILSILDLIDPLF